MTDYAMKRGGMSEGLFASLSKKAARVAPRMRRCEGECAGLYLEKHWFVGDARVCKLCQSARDIAKRRAAIEKVEAERDRLLQQRRTELETRHQREARARAAAGEKE